MARLTQREIDSIRCDLANVKEEQYDGEMWEAEPDTDGQEHDEWMMMSWDRFDELKLHDVYQDETYTHGLVAEQPAEMTVGEFEDLLSGIENEINEEN